MQKKILKKFKNSKKFENSKFENEKNKNVECRLTLIMHRCIDVDAIFWQVHRQRIVDCECDRLQQLNDHNVSYEMDNHSAKPLE